MAAPLRRMDPPSAAVHPPLPAELQSQLDALRRKEERWKSRLRSTKTQRLREERVRSRTREEEEERRRRVEDEDEERARRTLIDTAVRERLGARDDEAPQWQPDAEDAEDRVDQEEERGGWSSRAAIDRAAWQPSEHSAG